MKLPLQTGACQECSVEILDADRRRLFYLGTVGFNIGPSALRLADELLALVNGPQTKEDLLALEVLCNRAEQIADNVIGTRNDGLTATLIADRLNGDVARCRDKYSLPKPDGS